MVSSSKDLKVLHICQRDDAATGGAARVAVEYVKRLHDYDIDAHCLFLYGQPGFFGSELGDRAHYLNIANSRDALNFGRLVSFMHEFQPDFIHHHDGLLWTQLLTFFHPGVLKFAHAHLDATSDNTWPNRGNIAAWVQLHSTDLLVCITESTRSSYVKQGGYSYTNTKVIYNGVDRSQFYPPSSAEKLAARKQFGLPENAFIVGYVGRLHCVMKGTDDFLRVISLLPDKFWALVVGSGPDSEYLHNLATELNIADRVVFAGTVNRTTSAYHALDVFCMTSHYEPFGLVAAEAMSCRVPVVGFACTGGVGELLNHSTGAVIQNRDISAMADTIVESVDRLEQWDRYHQNARSLLESNHDWDKNVLNLANLYKETIFSDRI